MMNLSQYPLWLTAKTAIIFVAINIIMMVIFSVYYWWAFYIEKHPSKNRLLTVFIRRSYLPYIALTIAITIGLIFSGQNHFHNLYININSPYLSSEQARSWQMVSFGVGFGQWVIAIVFLAFLWATPTMMYVSIRRIMLENNSFAFFVKKGIWMVVIAGVSAICMLLLIVMPFNRNDTSLSIFTLNHHLDDQFYYDSRWLFKYAFLTKWYPIFFLVYVFGWMLIMLLINYLEIHHGKKIIFDTWLGKFVLKNRTVQQTSFSNFPKSTFIVNSTFTPLVLFGWMAILDLFPYLSSFIVFNSKAPFTHLMFIFILLLIFCSLMLITFLTGLVKYRKNPKLFIRAFGAIYRRHSFKWVQKLIPYDTTAEQWMQNKLAQNGQTSLNMCQELVAGVSFTIFLGLTNFTQFDAYNQVGISGYTAPFHTAYYWLSLFAATLIVNYMFVDIRQQVFLSKISIGAAAYHVTPGMQSSWLNFLGQWMTFNSTIIDDQIRLLI